MKLPPGYVHGHGLVRQHYNGYGKKLMEQMGWSEGKGLGKKEDGMVEAIKVKKKEDNLGVGTQVGYRWDTKWWEGAFNSIAAKISAVNAENSDSESSSSDSESDSDAEAVQHRDGTHAGSSHSADELKLLQKLSKDKWGRWGGRDGKMARIREQEEKAAREARQRLGLPDPAAPSTSQSEDKKNKPKKEKKEKKEKNEKKEKKSKKEKKVDKKSKRTKGDSTEDRPAPAPNGKKAGSAVNSHWGRFAGIVDSFTGRADDAPAAAGRETGKKRVTVTVKRVAYDGDLPKTTPEVDPAWWGCKMFVSAGFMGSAADEVLEQKKGFTEKDQEDLYMFAHRHQRGRKGGNTGLGGSLVERPTTLGNDFVGKKVSFGDEEEGADSGEEKENDKDKEEGKGKKEKREKKRKERSGEGEGDKSGGREDKKKKKRKGGGAEDEREGGKKDKKEGERKEKVKGEGKDKSKKENKRDKKDKKK